MLTLPLLLNKFLLSQTSQGEQESLTDPDNVQIKVFGFFVIWNRSVLCSVKTQRLQEIMNLAHSIF